MSSPAVTRKRSRNQILYEEDELSLQKADKPLLNAKKLNTDDNSEKNPETPSSRVRRTKRKQSPAAVAAEHFVGQNLTTTPSQNFSTGKRGRPKRLSTGISGQVPKVILTPSKGKASRLKKSVAFGSDENLDLGFKDLPATTSSKKVKRHETSRNGCTDEPVAYHSTVCGNTKAPHAQNEDASEANQVGYPNEEYEDTACEICASRRSSAKNPMLLCEDCNAGYHIKCLGIAKVPEAMWWCKNCKPDVIFTQLNGLAPLESSDSVPDIENFEHHLQCMQRVVIDKLTGQKRLKLQGQEEATKKVYQVVEQTVLAGEGNSMLVIGSRGSGKTTLVESIISNLSARHRAKFHVVRLNGFVHTDDKMALKETWRQLGREMEVDDDSAGKPTNHADTLVSLLALLSHPSEVSGSETDQTTKSVIFILNEFHLFTTHPRQTLLYNLFDIAQARKAPIVVLGITTRVDVAESLEKRVKSRFSHRYVHLSLPRSLPAFWDICKQGLLADANDFRLKGSKHASVAGQKEFISFWDAMIEDLYTKDAAFRHHIQTEFYRTKSVPVFFTSCILPIANLSVKNPRLHGEVFVSSSISFSGPDSKLPNLQGLSELELALLIAAARLDIILDTETCNFSMAYDEYSSLTSRHKIQTSSTGVAALGTSAKVWSRDASLSAWEKLADYEFLIPAGIGGGHGRDLGASGRMWRVDVGLEEIAGSVEGLSSIMAKWCREI